MMVTVFMPVFNGEAYIRNAIQSVLNQTYKDFELLILNDGSTDGSVQIIRSFTDPRIRLLHNEGNKGLSYTRNRGFKEANSKYFAILDCDDIAHPTRLQEQVDFLDSHADFALIGSSVRIIDEKGEGESGWTFSASPEEIPVILLFQNYFAQSSVMLRTDAEGLHYRDEYPPCEDYELWYRLSLKYKVGNLSEMLTDYRIHSGGISKRQSERSERSKKLIMRDQLLRMGIQATTEEIDFHEKIGGYVFENTLEYSRKAVRWLDRLLRANQQSGTYNETVFIEKLNHLLKSLLEKNGRLGKEFFSLIEKSSVFDTLDFKTRQRYRLIYYGKKFGV